MKTLVQALAFAGVLLLPLHASAQTQVAAQRVEVPIRATSFARGAPRYSIPLTLGGVALDAMLDTGSYGLRVLSRALPANAYPPTSQTSSYGYGSGAQLEGFISNGQITIGGLSGTAAFELVQSVGCTRREPDCPMQHMEFAHYGIGGNGVPNAGFTAIVGVGLRQNPDAAQNPLPILGAPAWIVELPRAGDAAGKLILNPSASDLRGFTFFQLERQERAAGWADNLLPACIANAATRAHLCLRALIDSGAPGVKIQSDQAQARDWSGQSSIAVTFERPEGGNVVLTFTSNGGLGTHLETRAQAGEPQRLMLGTLPYFSFAVFYDSIHGVIGLKPRA